MAEEKQNGNLVDSQGNTIVKEETPDYGGFETLEALVANQRAQKTEADDLKSLKGRQGQELGDLRAENTRLNAHLEGLQAGQQRVIQPSMKTEAEINKLYDDGEITLSQAMQMNRESITESLKPEFAAIKTEVLDTIDQNEYRNRFIADNPGYTAAYDAGHLRDDMAKGLSAETAWANYQNQELQKQLIERDEKLNTLTAAAQQEGIQTGVKIEQGKEGAGKVLDEGAGAGSFSQNEGAPQKFATRADRLQAGVNLMHKMENQ